MILGAAADWSSEDMVVAVANSRLMTKMMRVVLDLFARFILRAGVGAGAGGRIRGGMHCFDLRTGLHPSANAGTWHWYKLGQ